MASRSLRILLPAVLICSVAHAQTESLQCIYKKIVSTTKVVGNAESVALIDDYAYVVSFFGPALQVFDVSDPYSPQLVGTSLQNTGAEHIIIRDSIAYIGCRPGINFYTFDVSDPANPQQLGMLDIPGDIDSMVLNGNYAYLTSFSTTASVRGIYVVDITDPSNPTQLMRLPYSGIPFPLVLHGSTLYLPTNEQGFDIFDCTQPASPEFVTRFTSQPTSTLAVINSDTMYATSSTGNPRNIDISNPLFPIDQGSVNIDNFVSYVLVGDVGYFASSRGVFKYDLSNSSSPLLLGSIDSPSGGTDIQLAHNLLYVTGSSNGLDILSTDLPTAQPLLAELAPRPFTISSFYERTTALHDGRVYVAHRANRATEILTVDVTTPEAPMLVGATTNHYPTDIKFVGSYAHTANPNEGYQVFDYNDPDTWVRVGFIDDFFQPIDIEIHGDFAFVAANPTLTIVDISDPLAPLIVGGVDSTFNGYSVEIDGSTAYVSGFDRDRLLIADITDPINPSLITTFTLPRDIVNIELVGDTIYATAGLGLVILDVSEPSSPVVVADVPLDFDALNLFYNNGSLYLAGQRYLTILDVTDPTQPIVTGWYDPRNMNNSPTGFLDVVVEDGIAYFTAGFGGLQLLDVSGPCSVHCLADTNNDGVLSPADFTAWIAAFNTQAPECDQNSDGLCTPADFTAWIANYNAGCN